MARDEQLEAMEYVLALVDGGERRTFELALLDEPGLAATVWRIEEGLAPLGAVLAPRKPSERVWRTLQRNLAAPKPKEPPRQKRQKVAFWRALTGFFAITTIAALCAVAVLAVRPEVVLPPSAAIIAPLEATDGTVTLARVQPDGTVVVEPFGAATPSGELEAVLWLVDEGGAARPLGVLAPEGRTSIEPQEDWPAALTEDPAGARLEVTAEPKGSAAAAPTGQPIATGTLRAM